VKNAVVFFFPKCRYNHKVSILKLLTKTTHLKLKYEVRGDVNLFPYIDVFWRPPPFEASNSKKCPIWAQNTVFRLRYVVKKVTTFSATPQSNCYIRRLPEGGCAPFCLGGLKGAVVPLIAKKILDMWRAKISLRSILG
jgi:hypothetical protein